MRLSVCLCLSSTFIFFSPCKLDHAATIPRPPVQGHTLTPQQTTTKTTAPAPAHKEFTMSVLQGPLVRSANFLARLQKKCHCEVTGVFFPSFDKEEPINYTVTFPASGSTNFISLIQRAEKLYNHIRANVLSTDAANFHTVTIGYKINEKITPFEYAVNPVKNAVYIQ